MKSKFIKAQISWLLVATFTITGIVSDLSNVVQAATIEQQYLEDFEDGIDGINKVYGGGIISHVEGGLEIQAANWPDQGQYTLVVDDNSPVIKDGVLELDMKVKSHAGRIGLVFRYVDNNNYSMVGHDVSGRWVLKTVKDGQESETTLAQNSVSLNNGQTYKMKVVFAGSLLELYVDGNLLYSGNTLVDSEGGKFGFRQWGYTDNYSHANYDNIKYYSQKAPEHTEDGHYLVSFDDDDTRGWEVKAGDGAISAANGKLTAQADGNNSNTISSDKNAPLIKDGFVETKITVNNHAGRVGVLFRYEDANNFAGIGYDVNGSWVWLNGSNNGQLPFTKVLEEGKEYKLAIKYAGEYITILIDDEKVYEGIIPGIKTTAGKIGLRNWGYPGNYSNATFDYFINGEFSPVTLSPDRKFVPNNEAGTYDVQVTLEGENQVSKLFVGENELVLNEDYLINGKTLTIKKEYIGKVKNNGDTDISILFADGYVTNFKLQVQLPPDEANEYLRDFSNGIDGMKVVSGSGTITNENNHLVFASNGDSIVIDENSPELFNSSVEFVVDPKTDAGNIGAVVRYSENGWSYIGIEGSGNQYGTGWFIKNSNGQRRELVTDSTRIYANRVEPYKVKIKVVENTVTIYLDGAEIYNGVVNELTRGRGKAGLRVAGNNTGTYQYLAVNSENVITSTEAEIVEKEIKSEKLSVKMDANFPRVIDYTYLENNKKMYGQEKPVHLISINNKNYVPQVTSEFNGNKAIYHLNIEEIQVSLDVVFTVENNTLTMKIENVNEGGRKVETINFPNHSLVSIRNTAPNAEMNLANYANNDIKVDLTTKTDDEAYKNTSIAILSSDELAASIKNNSIKNQQEINYQTFVVGDHYSTGLWTNEYLYRGLDGKIINEPYAKVTITADRNSDDKVDYQDGAIALRDDISEKRLGVDLINNAYSSVAMNVGSNAQYPFLRILDNIKKFNLITDGFEQTIIIKGYQVEGHDSNHPDFANISERAGGLEEFKTLLSESAKYNANIGVHINHTEAYPEAKQYGPNLVSTVPGWSWYDSANQIIRENDILDAENGMAKRLEDLAALAPGLDLVYIDVYMDGRWPAHKLTSKLNDLGLAVASEYAKSLTKTSVWAHHAYNGGYGTTSELARFVNHTEQDIFGGNNLFRGNSRPGINGWQNESNLNTTVSNFFTSQLPFKYLMNYPVSRWEDNAIYFGDNNEVVSKMDNGVNVITKDGKEIARGNKIFIPWDSKTEDKIYHWNDSKSATTWELPNSWSDVSTVYLYELTDLGKVNEKEVTVNNGRVTLDVKANTGYVVYKGQQLEEKVEWSTGAPIKDMGFDSHSFDYWKKSSTANSTDHISVVNNAKANSHLRVEGENDATITQTATGLVPGQSYAASVWVEVSDGRKVTLSVENGNGEEVSNYTDRTNVAFGVHHTDKYKTNYQRVRVNFTVPEGETTAKISLKVAGGSGNSWANLDDVRIMKLNGITDQGEHYFYDDFENVDFGFGPFVSTESDNSHLSQTNAPYTDDTIGGEYSLKIRYGDYMRTIPATVRFKPNTTYKVAFDYIAYKNQAFTASIKSDKANEAADSSNATIKTVDISNSAKQAVLEFTTGNYDDYYLEIRKNNDSTLIVDNLCVDEIVNVSKEDLQALVTELKALKESDYTPESFEVLKSKIKLAEEVIAKVDATEEELRNSYNGLKSAKEALVKYATTEEINTLKAKVTEMKEVNADDYKQDSNWTAFQSAIEKAEALLKKDKVTSNEVTNSINELENTKSKLVHVNSADKSALIELLDKAKALNSEDYVANQVWQDFQQDIIEASNIITTEEATQEEVDYRYEKLKAGYDNVIPTNKNILSNLVNEGKKYNKKDYTKDSFKKLLDALKVAEDVVSNDTATRLNVEEAFNSLQDAIDNLVEADKEEVPSEVFKKHLEITVSIAEKVTEDELEGVVEAVVTEFRSALKEAKELLANKEVTQEQVNKSFDRLSSVMHMLSYNIGDKVELGKLIAKIEALDPSEYIQATWDKLQPVLNEANDVMEDKNAMEEEVKTMYDKLVKAFLELRLKPNKDKLQDLIDKVEKLDSTKYTKESWDKLQKQLNEAKAIMANEDANSEDVQSAEEALELALYGLVEVKPDDNNQGNNGGSGSNNNNGNNNSGNGSGKLPQTGGTPAVAVVVLGLAIGAAGTLVLKKKNNK